MTTQYDQDALPARIPVRPTRPDQFQYATAVDDRFPKFKIHRTLAHARSAISARTYKRDDELRVAASCVLYQRNDGGQTWDPVAVFEKGEVLDRLPWQPAERDRRIVRSRVVEDALDRFEWSLLRFGFESGIQDKLMAEFERFRAVARSAVSAQRIEP